MSLKNQFVSVRTSLATLFVFLVVLSLVLPSSSFLSRLVERTALADTGSGAVSLTTIGSPAAENFDTLSNTAGSTTNTTLPAGWYITETGGVPETTSSTQLTPAVALPATFIVTARPVVPSVRSVNCGAARSSPSMVRSLPTTPARPLPRSMLLTPAAGLPRCV